MPYCHHCGAFVLDEDRFCPKCGTGQHVPETAAEPAPAVPLASPPPAPEPAPVAAAPTPPPPPPARAATASSDKPVPPHVAAMLCYIPGMGWIASVIFLTLDVYRHDRYVRFHAFQGLFLAVVWLLASSLFVPFHSDVKFFPFMGFRALWKALVIAAQVVGIVKTSQHRDYRLPVISELADRAMA